MGQEKKQNTYYHITVTAMKIENLFSEECVKKQFLDSMGLVREQLSFEIYAYCLTNDEAYFLIQTPLNMRITKVIEATKRCLKKVYVNETEIATEDFVLHYQKDSITSVSQLVDAIAKVHMNGLKCAASIKNHWWSSYIEYTKGYQGITKTDSVLEELHSNHRRAVQQFAAEHKKAALLYTTFENEKCDGEMKK